MERLLGQERRKESERRKIATQYSLREEAKHSVRILLVEDNPVNQKLATTMLTKAGYHVELAHNGREAIDKFSSSPHKFDLIFMDVQMPKMDGLQATRMIRRFERQNSDPEAGHIPIIAMTAEAMRGDREECLDAGMDDIYFQAY